MEIKNIYADIPAELPEELTEEFFANGNIQIGRIVSRGHKSPPDYWYDQDQDEFVLLVRGEARVFFEDPDENIELTPGDWIIIPAHRRHRLIQTSEESDTIWLCMFYQT